MRFHSALGCYMGGSVAAATLTGVTAVAIVILFKGVQVFENGLDVPPARTESLKSEQVTEWIPVRTSEKFT